MKGRVGSESSAPGDVVSRSPDLEREIAAVEIVVGRMLQIGVLASAALVAVGTLMMIGQHQLGRAASVATFGAVRGGIMRLQGWAVVDVGLFLLILTPVMRVAVSIFGFGRSRDWTFVSITGFVLLMLITGFLIGKA